MLFCLPAFPYVTPVLAAATIDDAAMQRALQLARDTSRVRARFHDAYLVGLEDALVEQVDVITEFRRMVLIAEEHLRVGDWMFTRGTRQASVALQPWRGLVTVRARLRFNPLNVYASVPAYTIAVGEPDDPIIALATDATPILSDPFPSRTGGQTILGAVVESRFDAATVGDVRRVVRVVLNDATVARASVDFGSLE